MPPSSNKQFVKKFQPPRKRYFFQNLENSSELMWSRLRECYLARAVLKNLSGQKLDGLGISQTWLEKCKKLPTPISSPISSRVATINIIGKKSSLSVCKLLSTFLLLSTGCVGIVSGISLLKIDRTPSAHSTRFSQKCFSSNSIQSWGELPSDRARRSLWLFAYTTSNRPLRVKKQI